MMMQNGGFSQHSVQCFVIKFTILISSSTYLRFSKEFHNKLQCLLGEHNIIRMRLSCLFVDMYTKSCKHLHEYGSK